MVRRLFGFDRGHWPEMMGGTCHLSAGAHYTLHYHDQAEIYYGLSGRGTVYVGDREVDVYPGVAIYAGSRVVHGADALGDRAVRHVLALWHGIDRRGPQLDAGRGHLYGGSRAVRGLHLMGTWP